MKTILSFLFIVFLMGLVFLSVFIFTETGEKIIIGVFPTSVLKPLYKIKKTINPSGHGIKKNIVIVKKDSDNNKKNIDKTIPKSKQNIKTNSNKKLITKKTKQIQHKKIDEIMKKDTSANKKTLLKQPKSKKTAKIQNIIFKNKAVISIPYSPVYEKPDSKSKILTYLFRGDEIKIDSKKNTKSFTKLNSKYYPGYIPNINLEIFKNQYEHQIFISHSAKPGSTSPYQCLQNAINALYYNKKHILSDLIFPGKGLKVTVNPHNARKTISKETIKNCKKNTILINKGWSHVFTYGWILQKARILKKHLLFLPATLFMEKSYLLSSDVFKIRIEKYGQRWFCKEFIVEDNEVID